MAVANWSSSAMGKAVLLPLILVVLAMAAGASSTEDGPAVANSGGRFSETPVARRLLDFDFNPCGSGRAPDYDCKNKLRDATRPTCCTFLFGLKRCEDLDNDDDSCGSCNRKCRPGEKCCKGVCVNVLNDQNNCGKCGRRCPVKCKLGFCKY